MKYLKMFGLIILYSALPFPFFFLALKITQNIKPLYNLAPGAFWIISDPLIIVTFFLIYKIFKKQSLAKFANISKISLKRCLLFAGFGITLGVLSYSLVSMDLIKTNYKSLTETIKYYIAAGNIFFLLLLVPINSTMKEVVYRGATFNEMKGLLPVALGLIIQAICYTASVAPFSPMPVTLYAFLGAIMFGAIYYIGKSLWTSIFTQIFCTFTLITMNKTVPDKAFSNSPAAILFGISVAVLIALFVIAARQNKSLPAEQKNTGVAQ
jgi:membrane protease YdiL (CAAX protease family)